MSLLEQIPHLGISPVSFPSQSCFHSFPKDASAPPYLLCRDEHTKRSESEYPPKETSRAFEPESSGTYKKPQMPSGRLQELLSSTSILIMAFCFLRASQAAQLPRSSRLTGCGALGWVEHIAAGHCTAAGAAQLRDRPVERMRLPLCLQQDTGLRRAQSLKLINSQMAPHTSLHRQSSDCKIDFNLSPGPREVSAVVRKPQETAKEEGVLSQTVVMEFPALNTLFLCLLLLLVQLQQEELRYHFYLYSF